MHFLMVKLVSLMNCRPPCQLAESFHDRMVNGLVRGVDRWSCCAALVGIVSRLVPLVDAGTIGRFCKC